MVTSATIFFFLFCGRKRQLFLYFICYTDIKRKKEKNNQSRYTNNMEKINRYFAAYFFYFLHQVYILIPKKKSLHINIFFLIENLVTSVSIDVYLINSFCDR